MKIPFISPKQAHLREFLRFVATNKDILERIHSMALFPVEMIQVLYFIYHEKMPLRIEDFSLPSKILHEFSENTYQEV